MSLSVGCVPSLTVSRIDTQRIPEYLLTPIPHPVTEGPPYTVEDLLVVIGQYDNKLEQANDRFIEIRYIQGGERHSNAAKTSP